MQGIITPALIQNAIEMVRPMIALTLQHYAKREDLAVVVTAVEAIKPHDPKKSFQRNCYLVTWFGDRDEWESDYMAYALSKAEKSVRTGMPTAKLEPQYLLSGDTVYWGSEVLDGIVVACSGVEAFFDEMFSMWIAAAIRALCKQKFLNLPEGTTFIS